MNWPWSRRRAGAIPFAKAALALNIGVEYCE
jgi:hypothetical protein